MQHLDCDQPFKSSNAGSTPDVHGTHSAHCKQMQNLVTPDALTDQTITGSF